MNAGRLCEFVRRGERLACDGCDQGSFPLATLQPIFRECRPRGASRKARRLAQGSPPEPLVWNDLETNGPCIYRGDLVAIERCEIGCQREKLVETFLCRPDAAGPSPIASVEQWSHAQTLNRRRLVCTRCDRYVGSRSLVELSNASGETRRE